MALVSVQRSPSPVSDLDETSCSTYDGSECDSEVSCRRTSDFHSRSLNEIYFAVKGAAVILSHSDKANPCHRSCTEDKDIERHLQSMLRLVRQQDIMSRVIRLQSVTDNVIRYLAVVENYDEFGEKNIALFGFDQVDGQSTSIGLVVPIVCSTKLRLDGDGGITVESCSELFFFKPVSIQAMWSVFQYVHKELAVIRPGRNTADLHWYGVYSVHMTTDDTIRGLWHISMLDEAMAGDIKPTGHQEALLERTSKQLEVEARIRKHLRQVMQSVDLEEVTSADIRRQLDDCIGTSVQAYKEFIDREMLVIMGQLDKPSKIFEYLYLGTEWNASNWDELKANRVGYILNMTKEVDNFYPNQFVYKKIWVSDEASTELLMHWQKTYDFIKTAKDSGSAVLVHCKKGISRSSSTVIAYIMKEYGWSLDVALNYVKEKRNCITPNNGFMEQLQTFDGMLQASNNRHSAVFNPCHSSSSLTTASEGTMTSTSSSLNEQPVLPLKGPDLPVTAQLFALRNRANSSPDQSKTVEKPVVKRRSWFTFRSSSTNPCGSSKLSFLPDASAFRQKFCSGKVRQHREKFERACTRTACAVEDDDSIISKNRKEINSDGDEECRNVRSLVDVFENFCPPCSENRHSFGIRNRHTDALITSMT